MLETIERVKKISEEIEENATSQKIQDFIVFRDVEKEILLSVEKELSKLNIHGGKAKATAVACKFLLEKLKKRKDGK